MPIGKIAQKNPNLLQALQYSRAEGSWAKDRESKRPEVVASNWLSDPLDAISCAGEMREFNSYNPRVKNLDIRFSISFDDSDRLTRDQEKEFTMRVMKEMGVQEDITQYAVIRHNDTAHPHHHVEINRVGLDGAAIDGNWTKYRLELAIDKVEKQMGLSNHLAGSRRFTYAPGTEKGYVVQKANFPSRKGGVRKPPNTLPKVQPVSKKQELQDKILDEIRGKGTTDIEQLKAVLAGKGIGLEIRRSNADKVTGIKLFYENQHYKGMSIGLKASALLSELEKEAVRKAEAERQAEQARQNRDAISERIRNAFWQKRPISWEAFKQVLAGDKLKLEISGENVSVTQLETDKVYSLDSLEINSNSNAKLSFDYFNSKIKNNKFVAETEAARIRAVNQAQLERDAISARIQKVFQEKTPTSWEAFGEALAEDKLEMQRWGAEISITCLNTNEHYNLDLIESKSGSFSKLGYEYFNPKIKNNKAAAEKAEAERLEAAKEARKNRGIISEKIQGIFRENKPVSWELFQKAMTPDNLEVDYSKKSAVFILKETGLRYPLSSLEISSKSDEKLSFDYFDTSITNNEAEAERIKAEQDRKVRDIISAGIQKVFSEKNPVSWEAFGKALTPDNLEVDYSKKSAVFILKETGQRYPLSSLEISDESDEKLSFEYFDTSITNNEAEAGKEAARIKAEQDRKVRDIISAGIQQVFREDNPVSWEAFGEALKPDNLEVDYSKESVVFTLKETGQRYPLSSLEISSKSDEKLSFEYFSTEITNNKASAEKARENRDIISARIQKIFTDKKPASWEAFGKALEKDGIVLEISDQTVAFTSAETGNRYLLNSLEISRGSNEKLSFDYFNSKIRDNVPTITSLEELEFLIIDNKLRTGFYFVSDDVGNALYNLMDQNAGFIAEVDLEYLGEPEGLLPINLGIEDTETLSQRLYIPFLPDKEQKIEAKTEKAEVKTKTTEEKPTVITEQEEERKPNYGYGWGR